MTILGSIIKPSHICSVLDNEPTYQTNRDRLGVLLHEGWGSWDAYQRVRPTIYKASLVSLLASAAGWYFRGWRKRGPRAAEAHVVYPALMALSGAVAYVTKKTGPELLQPVDETTGKPVPRGEGDAEIIQWVDRRANKLRRQDPNFADAAIARTIKIPGIYGVWQETPEHVKAMIHCGKVT